MDELVSVIIPTHRGSEYIARAVRSVQKQTYNNLEIIIVDDNGLGTEEQIKTQRVVSEFLNDSRVRYIAHEVNKNGSVARNTGAKAAHGEYITLLDDDDEYLPEKIQLEVNAFHKLDEEWGLVYCSYDENINKFKKSGNLLYEVLLHEVVIGSDSLMVRERVWEKLNGFDESFRRHQDFEFTARVAAHYKIKGIQECGIISYKIGRNDPKDMVQARAYREHYIDKMMPLIKTLSPVKQRIVICSNAIDVFPFRNQKNLFKLYRDVKGYTSKWEPRVSVGAFMAVCCKRLARRINRATSAMRFRLPPTWRNEER